MGTEREPSIEIKTDDDTLQQANREITETYDKQIYLECLSVFLARPSARRRAPVGAGIRAAGKRPGAGNGLRRRR